MAQQYTSSTKCCATCAFWMGNRDCHISKQRLTVGSPMDKGKCSIPKGLSKGQQKQANAQCRNWQKCPFLK